jgi:hypothetical protein
MRKPEVNEDDDFGGGEVRLLDRENTASSD